MKACHRLVSSFVLNFTLANKFDFANAHDLPFLNKIVLNTFIQNLDSTTSSYYPRSLSMVESLAVQKVIIKNVKKTLKGKKSYQVVVSHTVTLRKELMYNFFRFFSYFGLRSLEEKFIKINRKLNEDGSYYFRIKDVPALPGLSEEFFKWPYWLDCFFSSRKIKNPLMAKFFFRYLGFAFLYQ
jgi:ribosomal protein L5